MVVLADLAYVFVVLYDTDILVEPATNRGHILFWHSVFKWANKHVPGKQWARCVPGMFVCVCDARFLNIILSHPMLGNMHGVRLQATVELHEGGEDTYVLPTADACFSGHVRWPEPVGNEERATFAFMDVATPAETTGAPVLQPIEVIAGNTRSNRSRG